MLGGFTALGAQLIGQHSSRRNISAHSLLRPLDPSFQSRYAQFLVFDPKINLIADFHAELMADGCRNDDPALFSNACSD